MENQFSPRALEITESMTLEEKAGQVFAFTFTSLAQARQDLRLHPGGFVRIYCDALTAARQHANLQAATKVPLLITADFERGVGSTISGGTDLATNMLLGATQDEAHAESCARAIAQEAAAIGVTMNFVPVLDVNVNDDNPIINTRSYGGDAQLVARMGRAGIRGTQSAGISACGKHFPGHGDTTVDSHTSMGVIEASRERLDAVELVPFRAAIAEGVDAIMSAHLGISCFPNDHLPATLNPAIMTDLLRGELGFRGVAISDALDMGAVARQFPPEVAIPMAINAGVDLMIMPTHNERSVQIVIEAVRTGHVAETRLNEAVARILTMKDKRGLLGQKYTVPTNLPELLDTPAHRNIGLNAARAGVTLVTDLRNALPVRADQRVAVVSLTNVEDSRSFYLDPKAFGSHLATQHPQTRSVYCGTLSTRLLEDFRVLDEVTEVAAWADVIIVAAFVKVVINRGNVSLGVDAVKLIQTLTATGKPVVLVSFGNPYLLREVPDVSAYICAYGGSDVTQEAAAELLCGVYPFRGTLPVRSKALGAGGVSGS